MLAVLAPGAISPITSHTASSRPIAYGFAWGTLSSSIPTSRRCSLTILLALVSLALLAASGLLLWQMLEQRKLIRNMLEDEGMPDSLQDPELVLTLKVRDPLALARRESTTGRLLADRLPAMTQKLVYQELMKELALELEEREIDVEIHIEYR